MMRNLKCDGHWLDASRQYTFLNQLVEVLNFKLLISNFPFSLPLHRFLQEI